MKIFFKKIIYFIICFLALFIFINICIENVIKSRIDFTKFKFKQNPKYIVAGNSRPSNAFNDFIIDDVVNIANLGEPYYFTFIKLRNIIKVNKKLSVIFLEFDNSQIREQMDQNMYSSSYLSKVLPLYLPFLTLEEKWQIFNWNKDGFEQAFLVSYRENFLKAILNKSDLINEYGGHLPTTNRRLDTLISHVPIKLQFEDYKRDQNKTSSLNLYYLKKCIDECRNNNVRVILMRTPLHAKAPLLGNDSTYVKLLHSNFNNIEFVDFKNFKVPDSCFADFIHFNYKGGIIFSKWFNIQLKSGLLHKKNMQLSIDSEIVINNNLYK